MTDNLPHNFNYVNVSKTVKKRWSSLVYIMKKEGFFLDGCSSQNSTSSTPTTESLIKADNATVSCDNNEANTCNFQESNL